MRVLNLQGRAMGTRMNAHAMALCPMTPKNKGRGRVDLSKIGQITHRFWLHTRTSTGCLHASTEPTLEHIHGLLQNLTPAVHYWQPEWEAKFRQGGEIGRAHV